MAFYLYRKGDGNNGNFPVYLLEILDGEDLGAALRALVVNGYISGHSRRRYIRERLELGGEENHATAEILEGPRGVTADNGAAWLTAELEPLTLADAEFYRAKGFPLYQLRPRDYLDKGGLLDKGARALLGAEPAKDWRAPNRFLASYGGGASSGSCAFPTWREARLWLEARLLDAFRLPDAPPVLELEEPRTRRKWEYAGFQMAVEPLAAEVTSGAAK